MPENKDGLKQEMGLTLPCREEKAAKGRQWIMRRSSDRVLLAGAKELSVCKDTWGIGPPGIDGYSEDKDNKKVKGFILYDPTT